METPTSRSSSGTRSSLRESSITRSRSRRQRFQKDEITPLLSNLSPAAILDALTSTGAVSSPNDQKQAFITASVENTSDAERAFGVQAAIANKKIREWLLELTQWPWDSSRDFERAWASHQLAEYTERIEAIKDDMATLQVQQLQEHVRRSHLKAEPDTIQYEKLEDFTAIVLATIVQSLPPLMQLEGLLKAWSTRLLVLRRKEAFLIASHVCQESMTSAWTAIGVQKDRLPLSGRNFTQQHLIDIQPILQDHLAAVGSKVDDMLDLLEGSHDTLPEHWIDAVDSLESDYSSWAIKAQELALNNDLHSSEDRPSPQSVDAGVFCEQNKASHDVSMSTEKEEGPTLAGQSDGVVESVFCGPKDPKLPTADPTAGASNTSPSSGQVSTPSRPGSVATSRSSRRSSVEIMSASIATNPGSPKKVSTPIRHEFDAKVKRYSSVKSRDIMKLVVQRRDSCPSAMTAVEGLPRQMAAGGTTPASQHTPQIEAHQDSPRASRPSGDGQGQERPGEKSESYFPPRMPSPTEPTNRFEQDPGSEIDPGVIQIRNQRPAQLAEPITLKKVANSHSPSKPKDKFEASISSLLDRIPADIRLKSTGAKTPPPRPTATATPRPKTPLRRSITPLLLRNKNNKTPTTPGATPSLTLAPAPEPGPKALNTSSVHDPEIKLYHLHQTHPTPGGNGANKESTPIKLYVRLVGAEGERVMVRVGGGWADLGDYLKDYALHHGATTSRGQRSVSDFHIQSLPASGSAPSSTTTAAAAGITGAGAGAGEGGTASASRSRPGSAMAWSHDGYRDEDPPSPSPAGVASRRDEEGEWLPDRKTIAVDDIVKQAGGMGKRRGGGIKRVFLRRKSMGGGNA